MNRHQTVSWILGFLIFSMASCQLTPKGEKTESSQTVPVTEKIPEKPSVVSINENKVLLTGKHITVTNIRGNTFDSLFQIKYLQDSAELINARERFFNRLYGMSLYNEYHIPNVTFIADTSIVLVDHETGINTVLLSNGDSVVLEPQYFGTPGDDELFSVHLLAMQDHQSILLFLQHAYEDAHLIMVNLDSGDVWWAGNSLFSPNQQYTLTEDFELWEIRNGKYVKFYDPGIYFMTRDIDFAFWIGNTLYAKVYEKAKKVSSGNSVYLEIRLS